MTPLPEIKNTSYRLWALPILRALSGLGGEAAPIKIEEAIRKLPTYPFSELQWARAIKGKYVRWAGSDLKKLGLLAGTGEWGLTDLGRAYLDAHDGDVIQWPKVMPLDQKLAGQILAPLETVDVTDFAGYEIPALRALARGSIGKKHLVAKIEADLRDVLLPGDRRTMNAGYLVYEYRVSWCLSNLKKAGDIRNPTTGTWEMTEAGRVRLDRELAGWQIAPFQDSKAKVRAEWVAGAPNAVPNDAPAPSKPAWPTPTWTALEQRFDDAILEGFFDRVRPDLGPSPEVGGSLARNVILYGPPGTGKTFVAKAIAQALTGEPEPDGEGPWTIVQFHPSYSYEDFVQGLRPDLSQPQLRYEIRKGPFFELCAAAEKEPDKFYVLVIDEINRGDPARIFGELLYALEYRGEAVELALGGQLRVPPNLVVVGTMNSVDRSVALVDYALRRRFAFVRIDPDPDAIRQARVGDPDGGELGARTLERFNEWIEARLDREHALGHSFFMSRATESLDAATLAKIWRNDVLPLLEEYFYGDPKALADADKAWRSGAAEPVADVSISQLEIDDASP